MSSITKDNNIQVREYNSINSEQLNSRPSSPNQNSNENTSTLTDTEHQQDTDPAQGGLFRTPEEKRRFIKQQLISVGLLVFIDVGLPLAIYYVLKMYVSQLVALILSGIPPFINVIVKFIMKRKIDALGCIFVFSYVLSGILSVISGDVRLALLRDSTVTCVVSCAFFVTLIPINTRWFVTRPLTYIVAQSFVSELPPVRWVNKDGQDEEQPLLEFLWTHVRFFRWHNYIMTFLWGFCLMGEFISKLLMIKSDMSVDDIVWISNVIVIVVVVVLSCISSVGSVLVRRKSKKYVMEWRTDNDFAAMYQNDQAGKQHLELMDQPAPTIMKGSNSQLV